MSSFDIVVVGTGSGGGTMLGQLVRRFPFAAIAGIEAGKDYPTADDREANFLQSVIDDKLGKNHPYKADLVVSNYGTDPASPYFGTGFPFVVPTSEQSMAKRVGGSGEHNGMVCGRARPEDLDEWDYALRNGQSQYDIPGNITWALGGPGNIGLTGDAASVASIQAELATGRPVFISRGDNPKLHPPFRVVSAALGAGGIVVTTNLRLNGVIEPGTGIERPAAVVEVTANPVPPGDTISWGAFTFTAIAGARTPGADDFDGSLGTPALIAAEIAEAINDPANSAYAQDAYGDPIWFAKSDGAFVFIYGISTADLPFAVVSGGGELSNETLTASAANVYNTEWNRSRMLECYCEVEYDIDTDFDAGVTNPIGVNPAVHSVDGYTEMGRLGRRRSDPSLIGGDPSKPWMDQRPLGPANTNVIPVPIADSVVSLAALTSETESTQKAFGYPTPENGGLDAVGAYTGVASAIFPYHGDVNNWMIRRPPGIAPGTPWGRASKITLNYVGFSALGEPVCGGRGGIGVQDRSNKYDERRGPQVTSINAVRSYRILTASIAVDPVVGPGRFDGGPIEGANGATGTVVTPELRREIFYTSDAAYAALAVGDVIDSVVPLGKSGTVVQAPSIVYDGTFTAHVKIVLDLALGTEPFSPGDTFERTAVPLGGGTVDGTFLTPAFAPVSPSCTQRLQVLMDEGSVEFENADAIVDPVIGATMAAAPVNSMTIISEATVDKLNIVPSVYIDVILTDIAVGTPAVGDDVVGFLSGATGTVTEVTTINGLAATAFVRIQVADGQKFQQGEPINEAAAAWTSVGFKITPVQQCTGVVYWKRNDKGVEQKYTLTAPSVVLSAGAFATPAICQRSGIGAQERLSAAGVEQVLDLPGVGDRCITHAFTFSQLLYLNAAQPSSSLSYLIQHGVWYRSSQDRSGLGYEVGANNASGPLLFDDEYDCVGGLTGLGIGVGDDTFAAFSGPGFGLFTKRLFASPQIEAENVDPTQLFWRNRLAGTDAILAKPRSRGRGVFIKSDDPFTLPKIDQGTMRDWRSKDAEALLEFADQMFAVCVEPFGPPTPGGFADTLLLFPLATPPAGAGSTADRVNALMSGVGAAYHAVGTMGMGPVNDPLAVCDSRGRVRHMIGVRVADNSIYPTHVRFNPHYHTVTAAHNIAAMMAEDAA